MKEAAKRYFDGRDALLMELTFDADGKPKMLTLIASLNFSVNAFLTEIFYNFRKNFFEKLYNVDINSDFLKAMAVYEYEVMLACLPSEAHLSVCDGNEEAVELFKDKYLEFLKIERQFFIPCIFEPVNSKNTRKDFDTISGKLKIIAEFISQKYYSLEWIAQEREVGDGYFDILCACCCRKQNLELKVNAVKSEHIKGLESDNLIASLNDLGEKYDLQRLSHSIQADITLFDFANATVSVGAGGAAESLPLIESEDSREPYGHSRRFRKKHIEEAVL